MINLLADKDKRKYRIIKSLFQSLEPVTITDLAKITDSSIRTVKYDLQELKLYLSQINGELISSMEGLTLNLPSHIGLDYFQRELYEKTPGFELIEIIFFNETLTHREMEELLFMSSSSLKRLVTKVKNALSPYGLTILSTPFRISGDETLIRSFYTIYFKERYSIKEWPFQGVYCEMIDAGISAAIDYYDISSDLYGYHNFMFQHAVEIVRAKNGHFIQDISKKSDSFLEKQFRMYKELVRDVIDHFNISEDEVKLYFSQLVNWKFYLFLPYFKDCIQTNLRLEKRQNEILTVVDLISHLFEIPPADHTYLVFELNNILELYSSIPNTDNYKHFILFNTQNEFLLSTYKNNYPIFYDFVEEQLIHLCKKRNVEINQHFISNLIFTLLSRWINLSSHLHNNFNTCHVLVYSHESRGHASNIVNHLSASFNSTISFSIFEKPDISDDSLADLDFDILVTTTTLFLSIPQPVFYLYPYNMNVSFRALRENISHSINLYKENRMKRIIEKINALRKVNI